MEHISELGTITDLHPFEVEIFRPDRYVEGGINRREYLRGFEPKKLEKTLVFFDPDKGFETETQRSLEWVRHREIENTLLALPENSAVVVYQHRPRYQSWDTKMPLILSDSSYASSALAISEPNLAFVILCNGNAVNESLVASTQRYIQSRNHPLRFWPGP